MTGPSATTPRNEAAERLRSLFLAHHTEGPSALDAALSEERRLTVERIHRVLEPLADQLDLVSIVAGDRLRAEWRKAHDAALDEIGGSR